MDYIMQTLSTPLNVLMSFCYGLSNNYILAIILFTLLTKLILLPISLWMQRNSIKMVEMMPELNRLKIKYFGDRDTIAEETQALYKRRHYHQFASMLPMVIQIVMLMGVIAAVKHLLDDSNNSLLLVPFESGGLTLLMPLAAGAAALALGFAQNKLNPLQREQGKREQWMTNGMSVAISLVLGFFVSLGVGVYWIASNLLTIAQQLLLNTIIKPKKYIDYDDLKASKEELAKMEGLSSNISKEDKQREKADYKRFFSIANKHLVFYSESSGFYKYFKSVIEELLARSNVTIHYITSDPKDQIFEIAKQQPRIRPYYIGEKRLITLMMKMDADIVVMTVPDLDNYHIKRSYVRKDIEYIYMFHYPLSTHMVLHTGALDHYDTVMCVGKFQFDEIRFGEKLRGTREKKLVECGYGLLEDLQKQYDASEKTNNSVKKVLIAPSWQQDNILDSCIDKILGQLLGKGYKVVVRPHPEYMKRYRPRMDAIVERYASYTGGDLEFELDFSSSNSIFESDLVITDWSGTAYEFAFVTKRPAVFINTPPKVNNEEYSKYPMKPLELTLRSQVGIEFDMDKLDELSEGVARVFDMHREYSEQINRVLNDTISNYGHSAEVGAQYIINCLKERRNNGR